MPPTAVPEPDPSGLTRAQLLHRGLAAGLAVGAAGVLADGALGATQAPRAAQVADGMAKAGGIHRFEIEVSKSKLSTLRRRIAKTRLPSMELVADRSQGVQRATVEALARFWVTEYDWRACEDRLNALPNFRTEIDGLKVHFIHVRSRHEDALPLIMTHGWPGSIIELLETVGPLTDPTAHGGRAEDAFDLVLPSIPGYGFSRCTGSRARAPRRPGRTGRARGPKLWPAARLLRRSGSRSASARSPASSSRPRAAGSNWATRTSSTTTSPPGPATSPPGKSPSCSPPSSARRSDRFARRRLRR
jgi:hypothetical protein